MHLARRAPVAVGNLEGSRRGAHQQCRRRLRYTRRCSGNSRCKPSLSRRGADLVMALSSAVAGSPAEMMCSRWQRVVPERYVGKIRTDEFHVSPWLTLLSNWRKTTMECAHWMSPPLIVLSPRGPRVRRGKGIARGHFNEPLFRAAAHRAPMYFQDAPRTRAQPRPAIGGRNLYPSRFLHSLWLRERLQIFSNQAVALQRPRQARSHSHQSHRSRRRDSFVLGVSMAEQRGRNGS